MNPCVESFSSSKQTRQCLACQSVAFLLCTCPNIHVTEIRAHELTDNNFSAQQTVFHCVWPFMSSGVFVKTEDVI